MAAGTRRGFHRIFCFNKQPLLPSLLAWHLPVTARATCPPIAQGSEVGEGTAEGKQGPRGQEAQPQLLGVPGEHHPLCYRGRRRKTHGVLPSPLSAIYLSGCPSGSQLNRVLSRPKSDLRTPGQVPPGCQHFGKGRVPKPKLHPWLVGRWQSRVLAPGAYSKT